MEYSAFLEGYDKEWSVYTLNNKVTYTDVPAGTYTLRLRYKKDVYDILPEEFSIKVRIRRGFFRSSLFMVLVGLAFLGLHGLVGNDLFRIFLAFFHFMFRFSLTH